jgi:hypothetical protein
MFLIIFIFAPLVYHVEILKKELNSCSGAGCIFGCLCSMFGVYPTVAMWMNGIITQFIIDGGCILLGVSTGYENLSYFLIVVIHLYYTYLYYRDFK